MSLNNSSLNNELFDIVELLRNGACITGDDKETNLYRHRCLQQAYHRFTHMNIMEKLVESKLLYTSDDWQYRWSSLLNLEALHQTTAIYSHLDLHKLATP
jgi:hypothetical protein